LHTSFIPVLIAFVAVICAPLAMPAAIGSDARAAEIRRFALTIKNRKVDPARKVIRVTRGDTLELELSTDEAAELHLHGYDKLIKVEPAVPAMLRLDATIAGRFPVEAHGFGSGRSGQHGHVTLFYLEVHPR
jgi:hypothetical protein